MNEKNNALISASWFWRKEGKDNVKRRLAVTFSVCVFHKYTRVYMKKLD